MEMTLGVSRMSKPVYRSYEDWRAICCFVRRGEKSSRRTKDGTPLFARHQTDLEPYSPKGSSYPDGYWAECEIRAKGPVKRRPRPTEAYGFDRPLRGAGNGPWDIHDDYNQYDGF